MEAGTGAYTLSVVESAAVLRPDDDFEATTGTTGMVAVGGSATGEINYPNDRDWFRVTLEAGLPDRPYRGRTLENPYGV